MSVSYENAKNDIYDLYNYTNIETFCQEEFNIFLANFKKIIINYYHNNSILKDANTIYTIDNDLKKAYELYKLTNIKLVKTLIFNKILNINKCLLLSNDNIICIIYILNKKIKDIELNIEVNNEKIFDEISNIKNELNRLLNKNDDNYFNNKNKIKKFIEIVNDRFNELNIEIDNRIKHIKINSDEEKYNKVMLSQAKIYKLLNIFIIISLCNLLVNICYYIYISF